MKRSVKSMAVVALVTCVSYAGEKKDAANESPNSFSTICSARDEVLDTPLLNQYLRFLNVSER